MKGSCKLLVLLVAVIASGCTLVGAAVDSKLHEHVNEGKSWPDKKPRSNDFMKIGAITDAMVVKSVVFPDGLPKTENSPVQVPSQCTEPLVLVCSSAGNVCVCKRPESVKVKVYEEPEDENG
ncbi:hypothetical protein [Microbulbifer sp. ARAS458-1]|uniref:hypothetical protein n=1 Tax=Microbulbifer sp. ARAS458-1 TaxID=3140242 RepID=UPI00387801F8